MKILSINFSSSIHRNFDWAPAFIFIERKKLFSRRCSIFTQILSLNNEKLPKHRSIQKAWKFGTNFICLAQTLFIQIIWINVGCLLVFVLFCFPFLTSKLKQSVCKYWHFIVWIPSYHVNWRHICSRFKSGRNEFCVYFVFMKINIYWWVSSQINCFWTHKQWVSLVGRHL